jgi:hypothetical protein
MKMSDIQIPEGWIKVHFQHASPTIINPATISRVQRRHPENENSIVDITFVDGFTGLCQESLSQVMERIVQARSIP